LRHALINCKEFEQKNKRNLFPREKWVSAPVYNGSYSMWLDLSDEYVSLGCLHENYEPVETAFIRHNVSAGMAACDIGANIGWHTLGLAQCVGSEGAVYSFEPRQPTANFLRKTVIDNQLERVVQVRDCAIWDRAESLELNRTEGTNNPGGSFLSAEGVTSTSQKIEALPLDQAIPDDVSFVKIDIEGAEYNAFYGSEKFKSFRPIVLSEIHATQLCGKFPESRPTGTSAFWQVWAMIVSR
jgi:FkbM family methyltransferase